ncbi:hypothetical protein Tco_1045806 [Tanacetum coccineum]|uniref:DNA-directed DNA polymerase n=1 Tax=Tanacetum coccineum TaxID=301880 RepID=A0ABQ5GTW3_9ASTR
MPQTSHRSSGTMAILSTTSAKPLCWEWGDPGHVTIQPDFFFNKDLEYLWYGRKIGRHALSISKMKAAYYPDVGLEQMVPDQMWIEEECKYDVAAMYNYMKKIVLHRADLKEYVIAEMDFNNLYPNDHEFNEITKFSDGTLQQIDEALDYRVKEFRVNRRNRVWIHGFGRRKTSTEARSLCLPYRNDLRQDVSSRIWKALLVAG